MKLDNYNIRKQSRDYKDFNNESNCNRRPFPVLHVIVSRNYISFFDVLKSPYTSFKYRIVLCKKNILYRCNVEYTSRTKKLQIRQLRCTIFQTSQHSTIPLNSAKRDNHDSYNYNVKNLIKVEKISSKPITTIDLYVSLRKLPFAFESFIILEQRSMPFDRAFEDKAFCYTTSSSTIWKVDWRERLMLLLYVSAPIAISRLRVLINPNCSSLGREAGEPETISLVGDPSRRSSRFESKIPLRCIVHDRKQTHIRVYIHVSRMPGFFQHRKFRVSVLVYYSWQTAGYVERQLRLCQTWLVWLVCYDASNHSTS